MVDNFEDIKKLMSFDTKEDFYYVQILKRKKDNPDMDKSTAVIRDYYVDSFEYFDNKKERMIEYAEKYNARVTIRLNKRSYRKLATKMTKDIMDVIDNENYYRLSKVFSSCAGRYAAETDTKWIIDIDKENLENPSFNLAQMKADVENYKPIDISKFVAEIKSNSGIHLIVRPFNINRFRDEYSGIEVKKDEPTNLYIPNLNKEKEKEELEAV